MAKRRKAATATKPRAKAKAPPPPPFRATHHGKNIHIIDCDPVRAGWEQWLLVRSDAHTDNPKNDRATEMRHLDEALERRAIIIDLGDCLDLMQGVSDRWQRNRWCSKSIPPRGRHDEARALSHVTSVLVMERRDYRTAHVWRIRSYTNETAPRTCVYTGRLPGVEEGAVRGT